MSERIRTILAVAVLTGAIWVWADIEQTAPPSETLVPVKVTVPPDYVVLGVAPKELTVRFSGPKGEIQNLTASPEEMVCRLELKESDLKKDRLVIHARDGFRHWPARVAVTDVRGEHDGVVDSDVIIRISRLVNLKVRVEPRITGAVASAATAQPSEVTARVAESDLKALPEARRVAVALLAVSSVPSNPQVERDVALEPRLGGAGGIEATFDPPIVKVTARLESAFVTKSLGRFPILVAAPPEMLNRYRIVFQPGTERYVELEVQGPAPDIERLSPQDIRVQLILTADDKPEPASWIPGKLVVEGLPPGVKLVKALPTVNFNLEKPGDKPPAP